MGNGPTIKNAHSPAGMEFDTSEVDLVTAKDCPKCRYGTMDRVNLDIHRKSGWDKWYWICDDCGHRFKAPE